MVPYDVKAEAINDAFKARNNAILKWKEGKSATLKPRKKKSLSESIVITKKNIKRNTFYPRSLGILGNTNLMSEGDTRLVKTQSGFYFHILVKSKVENQDNRFNVIALDPGVRTFMTGYSPDLGIEIANSDINKIYRLGMMRDKLVSKMTNVESRKRQKLKKAWFRVSDKIKHLRDEVHWKTINWLVTNFKNVLIPEFSVSNMVTKNNRKLHKKTVRQMLSWSHYLFRKRLIQKAIVTGTNIWVTNESYTSKTCTNCGFEHTKLGGSKVFKCPNCNVIIDRDYNGARNILLRALVG